MGGRKTSEKTVKKSVFGRIIKALGLLVLIAVLGFGGIVLFLTITEYKPEDEETITVEGQASEEVKTNTTMTVMSWNIGYGALGEEEDFFMDGGSGVNADSEDEVLANMEGIESEINSVDPDILLLQETDRDSHRSCNVDETEYLKEALTGYENSFANNYKVAFIPYPWPMMGKVDCGISTFTKYGTSSVVRQSLPCPFSYPYRLCNLKRCLMVSRIPIEDSDKELVVVNLHLEAYDSGEGKAAQTAQLKTLLEEEADKGNYVIAGGDFNQTFSNVDTSAYPTISQDMWVPGIIDVEEFDDSLSFYMDSANPSCRSLDKAYAGADKDNFQYYVIDGFIVSSNVSVEEGGIVNLDFKNSDHNPYVMKVTLID